MNSLFHSIGLNEITITSIDTSLQEYWQLVLDNTTEFTQLALLGPLTYVSVFWLINIPLLICNAYPEWSPMESYKIQKSRVPSDKVREMIVTVIGNQTFMILLSIFQYSVFPHKKTSVEEMPCAVLLAVQFACACVLADFFFFAIHIACHTEFLYRHVHYVHHSCSNTIGIVVNYMHPVDYILNVLSAGLPTLLVSNHVITQILFALFMCVKGILSHCGYNLPLTFLVGDSRIHDFHHSNASFANVKYRFANLGAVFHVSDYVFGTLCEPWNKKEKTS